jgi:hypothetical protein
VGEDVMVEEYQFARMIAQDFIALWHTTHGFGPATTIQCRLLQLICSTLLWWSDHSWVSKKK